MEGGISVRDRSAQGLKDNYGVLLQNLGTLYLVPDITVHKIYKAERKDKRIDRQVRCYIMECKSNYLIKSKYSDITNLLQY